MNTHERFKLMAGPYAAPLVKHGDIVNCAVHGLLIVCGMTNGRISWPIGKKGPRERQRCIIVTGDLVAAIQKEAAITVCHWWGVSQASVTRWRKSLAVPLSNDGTHRLRHEYALEPGIRAGFEKALAKANEPEARAKVAAARRKWTMPEKTRRLLSDQRKGKKLSEEHRRKIATANQGRIPVWVTRPWTPEEDELVRTLPTAEVMRLTGRSLPRLSRLLCSVKPRFLSDPQPHPSMRHRRPPQAGFPRNRSS